MLFSHISDTHLGLMQYGSDERENDIYDAFNQTIDISIKDHVDFVIFSGDIFHVPTPNGRAILQMANALKRLKDQNIKSFFILGEHDVSRIRGTPIPYVYHNLEFAKYIGQGKPVYFQDVMLVGFDKLRKNEIPSHEKQFEDVDSLAEKHKGHKILVMHQGITEINKFAGELTSTDLPKNFTYYAMGHLHDHFLKKFSHLGGPLAYPGSIELTTSEGIKETKKGFYEVDISSSEAKPNWIELDIRPQFSTKTSVEELSSTVSEILEKIKSFSKKPIIELKIEGEKIQTDQIQAQISSLYQHALYCSWKINTKNRDDSSVLFDRPARIDDKLFKLAVNSLGSEKLANFAVNELLPLLSSNQLDEATGVVVENFEKFKSDKK
ncbi:MAG: DNA double-strand break repair protein Mre11 [Marine Group I thaumarchaeote]|nr:MAG: DNA double-strand break repair protein Mre11 [Marine Group I thaumarchaeote]